MTLSPKQAEATAASRILIVEDEGIIANHIASCVARSGYEIAGIAESSEEALAKTADCAPDLILMDIRIKGATDGVDTAKNLRERYDIPVLFLTAHTDRQTIDRAKTTGAWGFLTKPIHHANLATSIEMAIHKHRADREERNHRAWMVTVLSTMADAMAVIDSERRIQFLNRPAEELTGWTDEEARNLDIALVLPLSRAATGLRANQLIFLPDNPQAPSEMPRGVLAGKRSGQRFPIEGEFAPCVDGDRVVGAVITFRDATVRQAQENETRHEHKMQAVGRLAAGIAHDFNNLLCVILGYTEEMMRVSPLKEPALQALTEIKKAGDSAAAITQQLLKFSRKEPVKMLDIDLNAVIRDTEGLFRRLGGPAVIWQFRLGENLGLVRADHARLKQVLMNLVVNARDAMPEGGNVTIGTENVDTPLTGRSSGNILMGLGPFVVLSVADTGVGMSAKTAEHLFEPFFTTKGLGKGTGLGLSIVHSIVTDLGGTIQIESEPGCGATFMVYLPRVETAPALPAVSDAGSPRTAVGAATVLLVEDHESIRCLLGNYLTNSGCKVLVAGDVDEAMQIANQHEGSIDLLITDVIMPGGNGFEVARALVDRRPRMKTILMSGYPNELVSGRENMPKGACLLLKPFVKEDLLKAVRGLLSKNERAVGLSA
jgi:PAS domain S-box-containing protein